MFAARAGLPGDCSALEAMSTALAHRGPDGAGIFIDPRPGVSAALVHRRLAILDLPGGAQPMGNEDGVVQVVFNGEIYNHAELRRELRAAGHRFRSDHSDTEVLVHGWEEWGTDLPRRLLGMFAFAVWDFRRDPVPGRQRDTLFLARDRIGQKPFFYAVLEDGIVFGSTIGSVLAWPEVPRRIPRTQIGLYLQLGYLPPPQTIWRDIHQVSPGHWVRLRRDVLDGNPYWSGTDTETRGPGGAATGNTGPLAIGHRQTAIGNPPAQLRALLQGAVQSQMIADVPIACFLSGGVDSSIVAMLMQRASLDAGGDTIRTVSVGFRESGFDETQYAAAVAKQIGSAHTRLEINARQDVIETLAALMRQSLGQPFADSSILPTFHLSRAVRELATVALSGDGADEFFGGYDRYRAVAVLSRWRKLARLLPAESPIGPQKKRERFRRLAAAAREDDAADRYTRLVEIFPPAMLAELLGEEFDDFLAQASAAEGEFSEVRRAMFRDQREYLPGDVLWKVDSAAMAVALEVRSPFLDHRVAEFANALPDGLLFEGGRGKRILREVFAADLPREIFSRGKQGFGVPIGEWFRSDLRPAITDLLTGANSRTAAILSPPAMQQLLAGHHSGTRDHTHRLFALLMLEIFLREFGGTVEN